LSKGCFNGFKGGLNAKSKVHSLVSQVRVQVDLKDGKPEIVPELQKV
jgi:hypothetical protein